MRRLILLVLALSSVVLGFVLFSHTLDRSSMRAGPAVSHSAPLRVIRKAVAPQAESQQIVQSSREQVQTDRTTQDSLERDAGGSYSVAQQPTPERTRANATSIAPADVIEAHAGQATDTSVVGQPFPGSESVVQACKRPQPGPLHQSDCDRVNELLIAIAIEPRDEGWATATERVLRAYVEQEPGKFTIRAIECRKTICFIEAASILQPLPVPHHHFYKGHGLEKEYSVESFETDATGNRWTVSLLPFLRR